MLFKINCGRLGFNYVEAETYSEAEKKFLNSIEEKAETNPSQTRINSIEIITRLNIIR